MRHIAILCEYDGSAFHGWQEQENAGSVQGCLRAAWQKLSGESRAFRGCSRTDAGVSARGHVSDFFTQSKIPAEKIHLALNTHLPEGMTVQRAREAAEDFNARFCPVGKRYVYRFWIDPSRPAIFRHLYYHYPKQPNLERMRECAELLCGTHDFEAFMDQGSVVRNTVRTIDRLEILQNEKSLTMVCMGDGFLYHQVRILAGTLLYCGMNKLQLEEVERALKTGDRTSLGATLPASGLCLDRVYFPETLFGGDDRAAYEEDARGKNPSELLSLL